jgi:hypothetical protein
MIHLTYLTQMCWYKVLEQAFDTCQTNIIEDSALNYVRYKQPKLSINKIL